MKRLSHDINLLPRRETSRVFTRLILPCLLVVLILAGAVGAGVYFPEKSLAEKRVRLADLERIAAMSAGESAKFDALSAEVARLTAEGAFIAPYLSVPRHMLVVLRALEDLRPRGVRYTSIVSDGEILSLDGELTGGASGLLAGAQLIVNMAGSPLFDDPILDRTGQGGVDAPQSFHLTAHLTGAVLDNPIQEAMEGEETP